MSTEAAQQALTEALPKLHRMKSILRFEISATEGFTIDARTPQPLLVEDGSIEPDCTIKVSPENLLKLVSGEMDPLMAYTLGRIRVHGSMDVAMKLVKAIS